jgi:DNA-binding response OmpR family regulator
MSDKIRILVVDDEEAMRSVVRESLRLQGYEVDEADDGDSALSLLKAHRYDLMTLDLKMPRVDGLAVLEQMQVLPDRPDVIMVSGYPDLTMELKCKDLGAKDFVSTPFAGNALLEAVRTVLQKKAAS